MFSQLQSVSRSRIQRDSILNVKQNKKNTDKFVIRPNK